MNTKICNICQQEKYLIDFPISKKKHIAQCKPCVSFQKKMYRKKSLASVVGYNISYYNRKALR